MWPPPPCSPPQGRQAAGRGTIETLHLASRRQRRQPGAHDEGFGPGSEGADVLRYRGPPARRHQNPKPHASINSRLCLDTIPVSRKLSLRSSECGVQPERTLRTLRGAAPARRQRCGRHAVTPLADTHVVGCGGGARVAAPREGGGANLLLMRRQPCRVPLGRRRARDAPASTHARTHARTPPARRMIEQAVQCSRVFAAERRQGGWLVSCAPLTAFGRTDRGQRLSS